MDRRTVALVSERFTIQAVDGADDDGGTLYVLYDHEGAIITVRRGRNP